jgi:hypothetical protein
MKQGYYIGIIGLIMFFNVMLIIRISRNNNQSIGKNVSGELLQLKSINHMLYGNIFIQYHSENSVIDNIYGNTGEYESADLKSLLSDNIKLVFRYNENHCNSCVEEALKPLMEISAKIGVDNILILTSYRNVRTMQIYVKKYAPGITVFNSNEVLNLPIEKQNTPYFFVIDNTLKTQLVFVPVKEIHGYTREYLNILHQRYFNK